MADRVDLWIYPQRDVDFLEQPPFLNPLPLPPLRRRRHRRRLHGPVQDVDNSHITREKETTHRIEVFHTSIFLSLSINPIVVLVFFIVYPPASPVHFV